MPKLNRRGRRQAHHQHLQCRLYYQQRYQRRQQQLLTVQRQIAALNQYRRLLHLNRIPLKQSHQSLSLPITARMT